jgi:DNA-binding NtrC family response regulator
MSEKSRILVVDDEQVVRLCLHRTLASEDCKVETVVNGKAALEMMERHPFDVVLLDLRMPGMNGMEVLKVIKEKWPESEVIIVTGYAAVDTAKAAVAAGAYDYLAKPVGPDEIISAAQAALLHKKWALRGGRNRSANEITHQHAGH